MAAAAKRAIAALVIKQQEKLPKILAELRQNGQKTSHWIWWVFPTGMPGACEPGEPTFVTTDTVARLFEKDEQRTAEWQEALEKVCEMVEEKGIRALPSIDHGRIHYFLLFWLSLPSVPAWMTSVLERLSKFNWPPR
mmetsp:Transcript_13509/g.24293  ORF Transcript_13509/g.24293 Transcript_13509/m.24293 type:complete len:137 (+) Transcript_13509:102-512(+)